MSSSANTGFTKVYDTIRDSKVLEGLVSNGVLPRSARIIKASIDLTGQAVAKGLAVIDSESGAQVHLNPGEQILFASLMATTTVVSGGTPTFDFGLSAAAADGTTPAVATAVIATGSVAGVNAGLNPIPDAAAVTLVGASDVWVALDVNVAAVTTGVLQAVLIIV